MKFIFLLSKFIKGIFSVNYAILCNASKNYFNYRHFVNIQIMFQKLLENKFSHNHIVALTCEDPLMDLRFLNFKTLSNALPIDFSKSSRVHNKSKIINIHEIMNNDEINTQYKNRHKRIINKELEIFFNMKKIYSKIDTHAQMYNKPQSNTVIQNHSSTIIDVSNIKIILETKKLIPYIKFDPVPLNLDYLLHILHLRHRKLFRINENDNILIYLTGHGNDDFFMLQNRYMMMKDDIMKVLWDLSKRTNKVLLILDTCQAEALIDKTNIPENATVITTSNADESSFSNRKCKEIGLFTVDEFAEKIQNKEFFKFQEKSLKEFFSIDIFGKCISKISVFGDSNSKVKEFFIQDFNNRKIKPFKV